MNENRQDIDDRSSNMPTQKNRFLHDAESRLNNSIQILKNDLERDIQILKNDLERDIQILKNDLEKDIDDIKTRLRNVETDVAEVKGRRLAFKEWIPIGCSVIAIIISLIALYFQSSSAGG